MGILPGSNCSPVAKFSRILWPKFQKILTPRDGQQSYENNDRRNLVTSSAKE